MPLSDSSSGGDLVRCLDLDDFDLRLDRYRLIQPKADLLMARSVSKYSQLAPVVYCQLEGSLVLVDGFKRLRAARRLKRITSLPARLLEVDEHGAKAAIFNLNRITSKPNELEESWIIYTLVHDDGLPQVEVAHILGRHKSWVNHRLALIERLRGSYRCFMAIPIKMAWPPCNEGFSITLTAINRSSESWPLRDPKANWEVLSEREQQALQRLTESTRVEARRSKQYQQFLDLQTNTEEDGQSDQPPREDPPLSGDPENEDDRGAA